MAIELLFAWYKGEVGLDASAVQGDYSLIGVEFVNFIARLLDKMTYGGPAIGMAPIPFNGEAEVQRQILGPHPFFRA